MISAEVIIAILFIVGLCASICYFAFSPFRGSRLHLVTAIPFYLFWPALIHFAL